MKKTLILCTSIFVVSVNAIAYAETVNSTANSQTPVQTQSQQKPTVVKTNTHQQEEKKTTEDSNNSFLGTVHSGWNKMIDSIAGMTRSK